MLLALVWLVTEGDGRWHPGIGDPTFIGWFTVLAYAVTSYYCWRAWQTAQRNAKTLGSEAPNEGGRQRRLSYFWALTLLAMVLLGINKQLDLQTFFTQTLRDLATRDGWYEQRRPLQKLFIEGIAVTGLVSVVLISYALRDVLQRIWLAILGIVLIVAFVAIRAASFHHVDELLFRTGPFQLNWVLELSALGLLGWAARQAARKTLRLKRNPTPRA